MEQSKTCTHDRYGTDGKYANVIIKKTTAKRLRYEEGYRMRF